MSSFDARLLLPGQTRLPVSVVIDITDEMMTIASGDHHLGEWPLEAVDVDVRSDGFYLTLDREEVVLNVADANGFAGALGIRPRTPPPGVADTNGGANGQGRVTRDEHNGSAGRKGIVGRLDGINPEEQFEDVKQRISALEQALTDSSISPPEVFRRWLRLLKEINLRHGQGAMPTPIFNRLNTELLELIPVPPREPRPESHPVQVDANR